MSPPTVTKQFLAVLAVIVVVFGGVAAFAGVASAQSGPEFADGAVTIDEGETHVGDLEVVASSVVVAGTVQGDVEAVAGTVIVTDTGRVTGGIDSAAGSVTVEGAVDGDVSVAAGSLMVRDGAVVGGSLDAGVADFRLDGTVRGDVRVGAETLSVGPTAVVGGSVTYDAGTVSISEDADIAGSVTRDENIVVSGPEVVGLPAQFDGPILPRGVAAAYGFLVNLVLGVVLLAVAPGFARRVAGVGTKQAVKSGGVGLLVFVGVPIALLLLVLTIVGIPLSLAGLVVFGLLLWVTAVYGAFVVGTWLLSFTEYDNRWGALFVGVLLVALVGLLPWVGELLQFLVLLVGLGAFALAVRGEGDEGDESEESVEGAPTV
jgi:cytoskeletal protein CcmA (bactofilin family)